MKNKIKWTSRFKKEYRLAAKRGYNEVIKLIVKGDEQKILVEEYDDHPLSHNWKNHREFHILGNCFYYIREDTLVLLLVRTGLHSDLFRK